jgi:hypothetical protein
LSEIPDAVKMKTNLKETMPNISLKMPAERNFISVKNQLSPKNLKPKKINDCTEIINRVERAGCCLLPNEPETKLVLSNAVGDGSDYLWNPNSKAHKIRHKFFQQNFLQSVTEDFMLV